MEAADRSLAAAQQHLSDARGFVEQARSLVKHPDRSQLVAYAEIATEGAADQVQYAAETVEAGRETVSRAIAALRKATEEADARQIVMFPTTTGTEGGR